jgi:hypothetical protein
MKKPNEKLLRLNGIGNIHTLRIDYRQTGTDTADTFFTVTGEHGAVKGLWSTYRDYLDVDVDFKSVARLKESYVVEIETWMKWKKTNAKDLAEFERLKKKFT